jgi:hypothetical protein
MVAANQASLLDSSKNKEPLPGAYRIENSYYINYRIENSYCINTPVGDRVAMSPYYR